MTSLEERATAKEKEELMNELCSTLNDAAKVARHHPRRQRDGTRKGEWIRFKLSYMRERQAFDMRRPATFEKLVDKVRCSFENKELTMLYGDMRLPVTSQESLDTAVRLADECSKSVYLTLSKHGAHISEATLEAPSEGFSLPRFATGPSSNSRRHHSRNSRTSDLHDVPYSSSIASSRASSSYLGGHHLMADPHNRHFMFHQEPSRASSSTSSGLVGDMGSAGAHEGMQSPKAPTNWRQGRLLGAGSFGRVYICYDADTGCDLAVKRVLVHPDCDAKEVASVEKELLFLQYVGRGHPRIVQYMGVQREQDSLCIFMERLVGTIKDEIKANGPLTDAVCCKYTAQVLDALHFLHVHAHVIHRDIKSTNILRDGKGNVKVSDFGSCKQLEETNGPNMDTFVGTIYYMAPEKAASKPLTSAVDIWSLGCTLIEMLTGSPPWAEFEAVAAILKIVSCQPPMNLPMGTRDTTRTLLHAMLTREPRRRPNAAQLLEFEAIKIYPQCTIPRGASTEHSGVKRAVPILHAPPTSLANRSPNPNAKHTLI